jgi:hypothetical protein
MEAEELVVVLVRTTYGTVLLQMSTPPQALPVSRNYITIRRIFIFFGTSLSRNALLNAFRTVNDFDVK